MDMDTTDLRAIYSVIIKFYIMELITVMTFMLQPHSQKESPLHCKTCYCTLPQKTVYEYNLYSQYFKDEAPFRFPVIVDR